MALIVVVGAGTIGSHVLPHVARMAGVTSVVVIDRESYERSNLGAQNIYAPDIGKSKAQVQARRLKQIDRSLDVRAIHAPVEDLPLGWLRGDILLACLDSRRSRMVVNQAAWRLGVPWIDAGVDASGLVRVQAFVPSDEAACLECAWDARDYELVEQDYPCQDAAAPPATGATSGLGALAASLQALECEKILAADREHSLAGRDLLIDARHHRHYVTRFQRNSACRMPDHAGWSIAPYDADPWSTTLAEVMTMTSAFEGSENGVRMSVAGQQFAATLTCRRCRERAPAGHLHRGVRRLRPGPCPVCGGDRVAAGFDLQDTLPLDELPPQARNRPLSDLGLLSGDVLTFTTPQAEVRLEMGGTAWPIEF